MTLTRADLELVLEEIAPVLRQSRIQKIYQPEDRVLVIEFRRPGETHRLLVSCELGRVRLHVSRRRFSNPPTPPPFCQFLRAHFRGARLEHLGQLGSDRIVNLDFTTKVGSRTIVCELTGQSANIVILDDNRHVIRELNPQLNRRNVIGHPYLPPLSRTPDTIEQPAFHLAATTEMERFPISAAIEAHYLTHERQLDRDRARNEQLRTLRAAYKKAQRRVEAWREDLARAEKYRDFERYGELIKANLNAITTGMDRITLVDYYDEALPEVTLPLDHTKSAQRNMEEYFTKHRKLLTAERELTPRIAQAQRDLEALRRHITSIEQGTPTQLDAPTISIQRHGRKGTEKGNASRRRGPFKRFTSTDGLVIFVGRNARENEALTFRLAKSDDLWLHASGTPGSHVIVRLGKGTDPPPETLRDAALLALLYSDLKKSGKGEVVYTKRKWVKKAKGQAVGAVTVTQEQSIYVNLDTRRLEALKSRTSDAQHM